MNSKWLPVILQFEFNITGNYDNIAYNFRVLVLSEVFR